jgi:hypothetical protein
MRHVSIYQINDIKNCSYAFRSYDDSKFSIGDYKVVYETHIDFTDTDTELCEELFYNSNIGKLSYDGHTLSVSDLIRIDNKFYYCNPIGWKEINI